MRMPKIIKLWPVSDWELSGDFVAHTQIERFGRCLARPARGSVELRDSYCKMSIKIERLKNQN